MTIKPVDLQSNIGHIHDVGRGEHARQGALAGQQQLLDQEAAEKSNLKKSKLDESEKGEQTSIKDEDKKQDRRNQQNLKDKSSEENEEKREKLSDDRMGHLIDIFK